MIVEDAFDLVEDILRQGEPARRSVCFELFRPARSRDDGSHFLAAQDPGERQHGEGNVELLGKGQKAFHFVEIFLRQQVVDLLIRLPRRARAIGDGLAFAVFARQKPLRKGREGGDAHAVFLADAHDLVFDVPVCHVVLRLDDGERAKTVLFDDVERFVDLHGRPFGNAVIQHFARSDHIREHLHGLFDGRRRVEAVAEVEVHIVEPQIFQRFIELFDDVLARKPPVVRAGAHREEHFGRDDVLIPRVFAEASAQKALRLAARVGVGAVKKVDAEVKRRVHRLLGFLLRVAARKLRHPAAERNFAHFESPFP